MGSVDHSSITTSRTRYEAEAQCGWSADEQVEIREHRDRHGRRHGESRFICHDPLVKPLKLPCVFLLLVPTAPYLFLPPATEGFSPCTSSGTGAEAVAGIVRKIDTDHDRPSEPRVYCWAFERQTVALKGGVCDGLEGIIGTQSE